MIWYAVLLALILFALGHIIKWALVLIFRVTEREAAIGAFGFSVGQALAIRLFEVVQVEIGAVEELIGSFVGLALLWWTFFKQKGATVG